MEASYYPPSSDSNSDSPLSLFSTPTASQVAFTVMREGANKHHSHVINAVLNSEPIKDFIAAKASFALKEGVSPHHSVDATNRIAFPTLQDARAQSNRTHQVDLASISSPSSPCSPQASNFTAEGSPSSQRSLALMHLSPPLMEKLEADLVLLQKKYGLASKALTPARIPLQDASSVHLVQAELLSSKQAAMGTFSPLRHNNGSPPTGVRTEAPFGLLAGDSSSPFHSPTSLTSAQISILGLPGHGKAHLNPIDQFRESTVTVRGKAPLHSPIGQSSSSEPARGNASPHATPTVRGNPRGYAPIRGKVPPYPTDQFMGSTLTARGNAPILSPIIQSTCSEPAGGKVPPNDPPPAQFSTLPSQYADPDSGNALHNSATQCTVSVRENASLHSPVVQFTCPESAGGNASPTVRGNPRGYAPPTAQVCSVPAQYCIEPYSGNAPQLNSATHGTVPARGTTWAARLGGSRSTSSTPLSYFPPTLVADRADFQG